MTVFLAGATGATGRLVAEALLRRGVALRMVVRDQQRLPAAVSTHVGASLTEASLLEMSEEAIRSQVEDSDAVIVCLGHKLTLQGIFGQPRRLVLDAVRKLVEAQKQAGKPGMRLILMSSSGVRSPGQDPARTRAQRAAVALLRRLIPPHADNEEAAAFLRTGGAENSMRWVTVRPDTLIDAPSVSPYHCEPSPVRDPIFNAGKVSRINVADFIVRLLHEEDLWQQWEGAMPVLYNEEFASSSD